MNFLKQMRDMAMVTSDKRMATLLRGAADDLAIALDALHNDPTVETMSRACGLWSHGVRMLRRTKPAKDPSTAGGRLPAPRAPRMARAVA